MRRKKPDLLFVLAVIFTLGVAISGYTHSRGLAGGPDLSDSHLIKLHGAGSVSSHIATSQLNRH